MPFFFAIDGMRASAMLWPAPDGEMPAALSRTSVSSRASQPKSSAWLLATPTMWICAFVRTSIMLTYVRKQDGLMGAGVPLSEMGDSRLRKLKSDAWK